MKGFSRMGLRGRVLSILILLLVVTLGGGVGTILYAFRAHHLLTEVIDDDVAILQAASELEVSLANQKGFATYYFLDGDPGWLEQLGRYRESFKNHLEKAKDLEQSKEGKAILSRIESEYQQYVEGKDRVISLYRAGDKEQGTRLHQEVRERYFQVEALSAQYKSLHAAKLERAKERSGREVNRITLLAAGSLVLIGVLGSLLGLVLIGQVLEPIRRLATEASTEGDLVPARNEVGELVDRVHDLMEDRDHTRTELERSRARLLDSEKLAVVGRLAAGVAHSIRNPMTSIKMRLFSLQRGLDLSPMQQEDFEVVAEEMRRLETIVSNFLEFSRPHRLKMRPVNVTEIVDMTLELLHHRLLSHDVTVKRVRRQALPLVEADPEWLKEVLVNLVVNACEAMGQGGRLTLVEEEAVAERMGRAVLIRVMDTGPGIPEPLRSKVLEPFFTTKEEGTGLGLAIVIRILEEHGGRLDVRSSEEGATFTVVLPVKEEQP